MSIRKFFLIFILLIPVYNICISQVKIGVALPLMSGSTDPEEKKTGQQMLNGINDALENYNSTNPETKVTFDIEDTKRGMSATLEILNKFGSDEKVIAIFGPVYSIELMNNAGAAAFHKIPTITPTATVNFLAQNNPYLFQLNPTYDIRGRLMAKYAMTDLGMKNFIILSEDGYGKNIAGSFTDEVIKNNGKVEAVEYYTEDSIYLSSQLENLRAKVMEKDKFIDFGNLTANQSEKLKNYRIKFSNTDSLLNANLIVSIYKLFGKNAERIMDSLKIFPSTITDKTKPVIAGYVDAVYIPVGSFNDIDKISLQYYSSGINLPILGTSDWNNEKALKENSLYLKELYFDSDFYLKDGLNDEMTGMTDSDIKNYYFGYDGMKLILDKIVNGNNTRDKLNSELEKTKHYKSFHNDIDITDRTNRHMSIMYFNDGKLIKLKDFVY